MKTKTSLLILSLFLTQVSISQIQNPSDSSMAPNTPEQPVPYHLLGPNRLRNMPNITKVPDLSCYNNIYYLKYMNSNAMPSFGTSFFIQYGDSIFLITAKHLFRQDIDKNNIATGDTVFYQLHMDGGFHPYVGKIYFRPNDSLDLVVIKQQNNVYEKCSCDFGNLTKFVGLEGHMIGFPGIGGVIDHEIESNIRARPFTRKVMISRYHKTRQGYFMMFIDGQNLRGFSGGPVYAYNPPKKIESIDLLNRPSKDHFLLGVVVNYYPHWTQFERYELVGNEYNKVDSPKYLFGENSGITTCVSTEEVIKLIREFYPGLNNLNPNIKIEVRHH